MKVRSSGSGADLLVRAGSPDPALRVKITSRMDDRATFESEAATLTSSPPLATIGA